MGNKRFFALSTQSFEDTLGRSALTFFASYQLVGAILFLGAIGYLLDRWLATAPWLLLAGLATGLVIGFYGLLRTGSRGDADPRHDRPPAPRS